MRARITKGSDYKYVEFREVTDLEGLLGIAREFGRDLVLCVEHTYEDVDLGLTVYDDYLE